MGTPEKIYELVQSMPSDQMKQVLDFVEFLKKSTPVQPSSHQPVSYADSASLQEVTTGAIATPTAQDTPGRYVLTKTPLEDSPKTLDFRQVAGLGQEIWSRVSVEDYIQSERAAWD
ncbi:MAG: DUF2281 domain-containing protein [Oculatellaceae cyanobacterium Prado106]|jgi:hypothetical protein|nr:DUF2281 domain-containing protein [Oculatellaceae cyanobacterium Prado106]